MVIYNNVKLPDKLYWHSWDIPEPGKCQSDSKIAVWISSVDNDECLGIFTFQAGFATWRYGDKSLNDYVNTFFKVSWWAFISGGLKGG